MTLQAARWRELLDQVAGQAHSSAAAVAAYVTGVRYHDDADMDFCAGPSCQWYRDLKAILEEHQVQVEALAEALEAQTLLDAGCSSRPPKSVRKMREAALTAYRANFPKEEG